jgi:hypothetical protein
MVQIHNVVFFYPSVAHSCSFPNAYVWIHESIRGHDVSDLVEPCGSSSMLMRDPELTISSTISSKGGTFTA